MSASPQQPQFEFLLFARHRDRYESVSVVYHKRSSSSPQEWWIRIMIKLNCGLRPPSPNHGHYRRLRGRLLVEFVKAIYFDRIELLKDTVTKITFKPASFTENPIFIPIREGCNNDHNRYIASLPHMIYKIDEDEERVRWPLIDQVHIPNIPVFDLDHDLDNLQFITPSLLKVQIGEQFYAYKSIERLFYEPKDTQNILEKIAALEKFRGYPNIAQIAGLVKSADPYTTDRSAAVPTVLSGFLLEYYPGGTLHHIMGNPEGGLEKRGWLIGHEMGDTNWNSTQINA
ncbi:hypothetical protein N7540_012199 [Penicillium herquei]|nr:hypothetical protein N7540_012199 [Penicillium herquei]